MLLIRKQQEHQQSCVISLCITILGERGNEAGAVEVIEDTLPWVVDLGEVSLFIF